MMALKCLRCGSLNVDVATMKSGDDDRRTTSLRFCGVVPCFAAWGHTVGMVPPSMTLAAGDGRRAVRGEEGDQFGHLLRAVRRPRGMPPSASMMRCRAASWLIPVRCAISLTIPCAASVSV